LGAGLGHYNGLASSEHSIHHWAARGIATRAVLVDIGRWRAAQGRPLDLGDADWYDGDELLACIAEQGTPVEPGDILLIRTGWQQWWRGLTDAERARRVAGPFNYPGIFPGERSAEVLWNLHVAAAATDTPALEMGPPSLVLPAYDAPIDGIEDLSEYRAASTILHVRLLVLLGLPIGELFELDALADSCAATGSYGCLITSAPINLPGAVGSPANALALR
jgi:kynurenine formamidase